MVIIARDTDPQEIEASIKIVKHAAIVRISSRADLAHLPEGNLDDNLAIGIHHLEHCALAGDQYAAAVIDLIERLIAGINRLADANQALRAENAGLEAKEIDHHA